MTLIDLLSSYAWWEIYLFTDIAYLIILNVMIIPQMWKEAKAKVGVVKWKNGPFFSAKKRFGHSIIMNMVHAVLYPMAIITYVINEKIFLTHLIGPIVKEVQEFKKEEEK